jgi:drug/metabolite transporter (DMT)-like permease
MTPSETAFPWLGLAAGLTSGFLSAVSYLVSRHHGSRGRVASLLLLVRAHFLMGIVCLPVAWLLWPPVMPAPARWLPSLIGSTATYLGGQAAVFAALTRMPPSILAPLLGLKLVMLAGIVTALPGPQLGLRQWAAVVLACVAASMLRRGSPPTRHDSPPADTAPINAVPSGTVNAAAFGIILLACLLFAVSDLCIVGLINGLEAVPGESAGLSGRLAAGGFAMAITYVTCGLIAAALVIWLGPGTRGSWTGAAHYATAWLGAMASLYICFGLVGAVFGNVLQSTRGVMAVAAGAVLARSGWHDLEEPCDRGTLVRRFIAAALMATAIAIFVS